jgi:hypothetical protein
MQDDLQQLVALIECYRSRRLWFLAKDFVPAMPAQAVRVLEYSERYDDRDAFVQTRRLKQWLSASTSEESAN